MKTLAWQVCLLVVHTLLIVSLTLVTAGDGDPLDCVDISSIPCSTGDVYPVRCFVGGCSVGWSITLMCAVSGSRAGCAWHG